MNSNAQKAFRTITAAALAVFSLIVAAQIPSPVPASASSFPVGRWVAEHPSKGGIASWWEIRADGTLTLYFGVLVSDRIDRTGDTFLMPSGMVGQDRVRAKYTISNNVLSIDTAGGHTTTYSRLGAAPNPADPLLGNWRPLPGPADAGSSPNFALMQQLMTTKGVLTFTADGMRHLRAPFGTKAGTWDGNARTFRVQDDPNTYAFSRMEGKLLLAQPPDGKEMDSYLPDPLPPVTTDATPVTHSDSAAVRPNTGRAPDIVRPQIVHSVEPSFTEEARKRKIDGTVELEVVVEADGRIRAPRIIKSAAEAYSDPVDREAARTLDRNAVEAVKQYTFAPGTVHGSPAPLAVTVEVSFHLF